MNLEIIIKLLYYRFKIMSSPQKINFSYNSPNNANSVAQQYYVQNCEFNFPSKVH